jgi:phage terminase small subunit
MPRLDNPRHEAFAQAVAKGSKGADAYRKGYGKEVASARQRACELMKDRDISERIKELQSKSADGVALTLREMHDFLRSTLLTAPGSIDENNPLCQSFKYTETMRELKMCDKLRALELAAKLQGMLREKVEVDVSDDFAGFFGLIRRGSKEGSE